MKRIPLEIIVITLIALTSLGVGYSKEEPLDRFEMREPMPAEIFQPTAGKRVACFITINSDDEKKVFTKYLDPAKWDLVELTSTDESTGKNGWFDRACRRGIQCDVDVISGHFAGQFFGSTGFTLGLGDLQGHSCANDCNGVLRNPKEVFLFGCNALATKDPDHRTREQYYQVLRADGYSHEAATRVVDDRYGPFGQDNQGIIRRAFVGVPYIYGYHSTSPLGASTAPLLANYMRKVGDYSQHIDSIAASNTKADTSPNMTLDKSLANKNFSQCSGLDQNGKAFALHSLLCKLFDRRTSLNDRIAQAENLMNGEFVMDALPSLQSFVYSNIREIKQSDGVAFARLQANARTKKILLDGIKLLEPSTPQIEWARFAHLMGWMTRGEFMSTVHALIDRAFQGAFQSDMSDAICSLDLQGLDQQDYSSLIPKLTAAHFSSRAAAQAMSCIGLSRFPELRVRLRDFYASNPGADGSVLAKIFSNSAPTKNPTAVDIDLLARLKSYCTSSANYDCGRALPLLGSGDLSTVRMLADKYRVAPGSVQMDYAASFRFITVGADLLEDVVLNSYLDPRQQYWSGIEQFFHYHPVLNASNQSRLLTYLLGPTLNRRSDEMIYALREMKMTEAQVASTFATFNAKPYPANTGRVFVGFLYLASGANASQAFIESIFKKFETVNLTNDENVEGYYNVLALPRIQAAMKASPQIQKTACAINARVSPELGLDRYGDMVTRSVKLKTCAELIR